MPRPFHIYILTSILGVVFGCGGAQHKRSYEPPALTTLINNLATKAEQVSSINTSSLMSYWQNGQRLKPTILVMAQKGSFIRVNALGITDDVEADLACNGTSFSYQDFRNNCSLRGICNKKAVSSLLKMNLSPDEFLLMAVGLTPLIDYNQSSLKWDGEHQHEIIKLNNSNSKISQTIVLDGKSTHWDVLSSKIFDGEGTLEWSIENKDFKDTVDENGVPTRAPDKTRFIQPSTDLKIEIRWQDRKINPTVAKDVFEMTPAPGIPSCQEAS